MEFRIKKYSSESPKADDGYTKVVIFWKDRPELEPSELTPSEKIELIKQLCPECNSENLVKAGKCVVKREETQIYRCKDCKRITHKPIVEN